MSHPSHGPDRAGSLAPVARRSGRSGPLSRERVLAAALALADAEGIGAVTMRRVGAGLGVEAMSLYHHLPGKDGLVEGLVETVVGEIEAEVAAERIGGPGGDAAAPAGDWRADVRARCLAARRVMVRHPWAPGLIGSRPAIPAAVYPYFEAVVASMAAGGLSHHLSHRALHALGSLLLGYAQEVFDLGGPKAAAAEETAEADMAAMAQRLPYLVAMAASEAHDAADPTLGWCDSQAEFEFTLDLLLDGLDRARARG